MQQREVGLGFPSVEAQKATRILHHQNPAATRLAHRRIPRLLTCPYLASCSKAPLSSPFTACEAEAGKLLRPRLLHSSTLGLWYGELSLTPGEEEKASGWSSKPCASA